MTLASLEARADACLAIYHRRDRVQAARCRAGVSPIPEGSRRPSYEILPMWGMSEEQMKRTVDFGKASDRANDLADALSLANYLASRTSNHVVVISFNGQDLVAA